MTTENTPEKRPVSAEGLRAYLEERRDHVLEGLQLGRVAFTLGYIDPDKMARAMVAMSMTLAYLSENGHDTVPIGDVADFVEKLLPTEARPDPADLPDDR